ncbi:MAG: hypothetical protein WDO17_02580 [Alphaproteobacteria bacterium]
MHPVLRSALEAKARLITGLRVAFALVCMFANELHATLARTIAYGAGLAAFALAGLEILGPRGGGIKTANPDWIEVIRPLPAFALTIPDFEAPRYSIWRHVSGAGRKDVLSFGAEGGPTATIEIFRGDVEEEDITASIAELRLSAAPAAPNSIDTKFGPVRVEKEIEDGRNCLHVSRKFEELRFEISGTFCNAGQELVDHGMAACALDRLSLVSAGSEPRLATLFARAELRRTFCGQRSVFLAATPKRTDWIDAQRDPKLRRASTN